MVLEVICFYLNLLALMLLYMYNSLNNVEIMHGLCYPAEEKRCVFDDIW